MAQNTPISLDAHFTSLLARETQLEALRAALVAGEVSGEAAPLDLVAFIADKRA